MRVGLSSIAEPTRRRRPNRAGALVIGLLALATLAGCGPEQEAAPRALEKVKAQPAAFQPVARTVSLSGTVAARVESKLSFRVAGRIAERKVDVGDHVKAGDVLATIETPEQVADVQAAKATLQSAEATLAQAQSSFKRQQQLIASGFTTRSSYDAAEEQLRRAESSVESARADVGTAEEQLALTVLKADADGVITARDAETGQVVSAAQTVFTLAQDGARDVVFDVYEALLADAPPSDRVEIRLLSDRSVVATAVVREIAPTFDTATGTVRVKMSLIDPPAAMGLGAAVLGSGSWAGKDVVVLPWTSLAAGEAGPAVWVIDPQTNAVTQRAITVERYKTGEILVSAGLKEGELVVTHGGQFLRAGQIVSITSGEPS
ncbi:efflux RND transporter periplasmic adaptor subunit [Ancylobacter rudongensis]|uniref:RND family efflux transporter, MFP subunit n=1 Tax=Ancylobacter rudongensis TaxID=177413 RepID=A0A1G4UVL1_9HYPH|nr:efflux RND transporter periplasmic adaptor subunit [Ancylobacter rudongensis]SCW97055.1 RND family efflux transporter, MFP subunit [Ancylobacter rudongensis]